MLLIFPFLPTSRLATMPMPALVCWSPDPDENPAAEAPTGTLSILLLIQYHCTPISCSYRFVGPSISTPGAAQSFVCLLFDIFVCHLICLTSRAFLGIITVIHQSPTWTYLLHWHPLLVLLLPLLLVLLEVFWLTCCMISDWFTCIHMHTYIATPIAAVMKHAHDMNCALTGSMNLTCIVHMIAACMYTVPADRGVFMLLAQSLVCHFGYWLCGNGLEICICMGTAWPSTFTWHLHHAATSREIGHLKDKQAYEDLVAMQYNFPILYERAWRNGGCDQ